VFDYDIHECPETMQPPQIAVIAHPDFPMWRLFTQTEPANGTDLIADRPWQHRNAQTHSTHLGVDIAVVGLQHHTSVWKPAS
jgi:hypothetical protein